MENQATIGKVQVLRMGHIYSMRLHIGGVHTLQESLH